MLDSIFQPFSNMSEGLKQIFRGLGDDYYFFVFLDPIFVWGIGFGLFFLICSLILKQDKAQSAALVVLFVSSMAIYPYLHNREDAAEAVKANWEQRAERFDEQTERRQNTQWFYYVYGALALATLIIRNKVGIVLSIATIFFGIMVLLLSMWLHLKESEVYHPAVTNAIKAPTEEAE